MSYQNSVCTVAATMTIIVRRKKKLKGHLIFQMWLLYDMTYRSLLCNLHSIQSQQQTTIHKEYCDDQNKWLL